MFSPSNFQTKSTTLWTHEHMNTWTHEHMKIKEGRDWPRGRSCVWHRLWKRLKWQVVWLKWGTWPKFFIFYGINVGFHPKWRNEGHDQYFPYLYGINVGFHPKWRNEGHDQNFPFIWYKCWIPPELTDLQSEMKDTSMIFHNTILIQR